MYFLKSSYFLDQWHETLNRADFISPEYFCDDFDYLIAVTHRWGKPLDADDGYLNFLEIKNRILHLRQFKGSTLEKIERIAIFYDYSCIYQTNTENDLILYDVYLTMHGSTKKFDTQTFIDFTNNKRKDDLKILYLLYLVADEIYMTKYHQKDYYTRCWCLMEMLSGSLRGTIIDTMGPFMEENNLKRYEIFDALSNRLISNINDHKAVKEFQRFILSASCTVDEDRFLTADYIPLIIDRIIMYKKKNY